MSHIVWIVGAIAGAALIGWLFGTLRQALILHAEAMDLITDHGADAAAEVERRIAKAMWRRDQDEVSYWRQVGQAVEMWKRPNHRP
jgi:hypothetical protein